MGQPAHAPGGPDREAAGVRAVHDPAVQALARIVHTYAPEQTSAFQPDHWRGLQPDPYALRRVSDALADRSGLDLELTAIKIAAEAITISPELGCATMTTCGGFCHGVSWVRSQGVSWIMNATPCATTKPAVHITACRLLTQASATDQHLRHRGLQWCAA